MLPLGKTDPQETPLCCSLVYRPLAMERCTPGDGIGWSDRMIRFQGGAALEVAEGVEVRLEAVRGVFPPLMVLAEVSGCRELSPSRFEISGYIKGIMTL